MILNIKEARRILSRPLKFGDPHQIEAGDLVAAWEEATLLSKVVPGETCDKCHGSGEVVCVCLACDNEHDSTCGKCGGTGEDHPDLDSLRLADLVEVIDSFTRKKSLFPDYVPIPETVALQ